MLDQVRYRGHLSIRLQTSVTDTFLAEIAHTCTYVYILQAGCLLRAIRSIPVYTHRIYDL